MLQKQHGARVLVLGASGKVGRLVRAVWEAAGEGLTVVPVVRRDSGLEGQVIWSPGAPLDGLPHVDVVLALWGVCPGPGGDLAANSALALSAAEIARATGADRVLHCSSAAVYAPGPEPLSEDMTPRPPSAYGVAKLEMELALADDMARHPQGPRAVWLRIGNVAGADSLFGAMMRSGDVHLDRFDDGAGPERSYIAPSDLAHVLARLATVPTSDLPARLNLAAPLPTAMEAIARAAGRRVIWCHAPAGAVRRVALDTTRLTTLCPLQPETARPEHLVSDWMRYKGVQ